MSQFSHGSLRAAASAGENALATPYATPVVLNALAAFVAVASKKHSFQSQCTRTPGNHRNDAMHHRVHAPSLTSANAGFCITTNPSAAPWSARKANACPFPRANANAAVAPACNNPLIAIARSNPNLSPACPQIIDVSPANAGFIAVSAPARHANSRSLAWASNRLAIKKAVEKSAVVAAIEHIEKACTCALARSFVRSFVSRRRRRSCASSFR
jgi:hypothetical protein